MIYICGAITSGSSEHVEFKSRGVQGTQDKISSIQIFGVPRERQLAYSGYKAAISAFLHATATSSMVLTTAENHPIPGDYIPSLPFPYPNVSFAFAGTPTESFVSDFCTRMGSKMTKTNTGRGSTNYVIKDATYSQLNRGVVTYGRQQAYFLQDYAQVESVPGFLKIYQIVDLFLRVNSYPYRRGQWAERDSGKRSQDVAGLEDLRTADSFFRNGARYKSKAWKAAPMGTTVEIGEPGETTDLTPHLNTHTSAVNAVLVAKPSPLPASNNIGLPRDVPNLGGLWFPYFPEMLSPDVAGLRRLLIPFIQSFSIPGIHCRQAFSEFRAGCDTFARTKEGVQFTHILTGMNLALDTQTQLYLVADGRSYLGFCLLGEEFDVMYNGHWHAAMTPAQLRTELDLVGTHEQLLERIAEKLSEMTMKSGMSVEVEALEIDTAVKLMKRLALVDRGADDGETKRLVELVKKLSFSSDYRNVANSNDIVWAVNQLTEKADVPLPDDTPCFIPLDDWSGIDSKLFQVFASFGSRGPSFRSAGGIEYLITKTGVADLYDEMDAAKGEPKYKLIHIGFKSLKTCVGDWRDLLSKGAVRMDFGKRSVKSMFQTYGGDRRLAIWKELKKVADLNLVGKKEDKGKGKSRENAGGSGGGSSTVLPDYSNAVLDF